ncbi:MAG: hypothetical protein CR985_03990 [Flavobacteriales bacterium]|nr:MAG: hypothetical protein CR985_03990 [Flavobacteriales bacterium]
MESLRDATYDNHEKAEHMPFNKRMLDGKLSEEEYLMHLVQQLEVFKAIENIGLPSEALSRVKPTQEDVDELRAKGCKSNTILENSKKYVEYLKTLDKESVLPHIYLNYLALMYGGQVMKRVVPSTGKMYDFAKKKEAMQAVRKVQKDEWADEANKGYGFMIGILEELETYCAENLR